jgi:hypothetical protein
VNKLGELELPTAVSETRPYNLYPAISVAFNFLRLAALFLNFCRSLFQTKYQTFDTPVFSHDCETWSLTVMEKYNVRV